MLGNSEIRCLQCTSQKIWWRTLSKTDGSKLNNVGNKEEQYTKLTLRSPIARHLWLMQLLLRECEEHILRCISKNRRISLCNSQKWMCGPRQGLFALKFQDTGKAGLGKESEAMPIGSLSLEKQRKLRLNCEPLCRHLPWLGWIKIKRTIYTACVLLRIPVILVVASPPRRLSVKASPEGSQIIQRWALVRKEPFQVPWRTLYMKANK